MTSPCRVLTGACLVAMCQGRAAAQSDYYNLDAGRPTRVEDAVPTARHELEVQLANFRLERMGDGTLRWRLEPKLAYGVLPFTEIELRAPVMRIVPRAPAATSTGIASLGLGAMHAFNLETSTVPAIALGGEFLFPVGSLSSPHSSFAVKALLTKTLSIARFQLNAGGGTWSVRLPSTPQIPDNTCGNAPGFPPCPPEPWPPDLPCTLIPTSATPAAAASAALCSNAPATNARIRQVVAGSRSNGGRWMAGLGIDRAFPLASALIAADVIAEQFVGLYSRVDWTAELGVRRQVTPQLVFDFGVGRRFTGTTRATSVSLGLGFGLSAQRLRRRPEDLTR